MNKSIAVLLIIFCSVLLFSACGPKVQDQTLRYGIGTGWYHADKSSEEMLQDFDECHSKALQEDNNPLITQDCLRDKGYILK